MNVARSVALTRCRRLTVAVLLLGWRVAFAQEAEIHGEVFERGSITRLVGVVVSSSAGASVVADARGRFTLRVAAGSIELVLVAADHDPLRVHETLRPGETLNVQYRMWPAKDAHRYQSTVKGQAQHEGAHFSLQGEELHTLPGTLGDPFRAIGLLPGVLTPIPLLPIFVVRGASPGMSGFFLDGMRVPQLFHLLIGGGVVQPTLVDRLDFYPGSYDVSFGHYAGGIIDAETRGARTDGQHLQVQLRLFDLSSAAELSLPHGVGITISGSYGWPGAIVALFRDGTQITYGDYQLRLDWKGLTAQILGSYDNLALSSDPADRFELTFHRVQLRWRGKHQRLRYEAAIVGGYDRMQYFGGDGVQKLAIGWRASASVRFGRVELDAGTDGELSRIRGFDFTGSTSDTPGAPGALGELGANRNGIVAGGYLNLHASLWPHHIDLTIGARADVYHTSLGEAVTLLGLDPRAILRWQLLPQLAVRVGGGVYHQPPSFPVPLPGIDTFALELGLQRAYQASLTIDAILPLGFTASITGYDQRFHHIIDASLDFSNTLGSCESPPPPQLKGIAAELMRQDDGQAYGAELSVRRERGRVTGWISYTLSRSERFLSCGIRPSDFDQTHTLNVVVQARLPKRFMLSGRFYFASGRPATKLDPNLGVETPSNNWRLPATVQLDVRLDREWLWRKWALSVFLELVNLTYSQAVLAVKYPTDPITQLVRYDEPQVVGFRYILPSVGVRGRF